MVALVALFTLTISVNALRAEQPTRSIVELNDHWQIFSADDFDSDDAGYVSLPHTWNPAASEGGFKHDTYNYLRSLYVSRDEADKRLFLRFGGAQSVATLFVNGRYVGEHRGGYTAFCFEITDYVMPGENLVRVEVSNERRSDTLPTSSDADLAGGLYRGVELICTPRNAISPLHYASEGLFVEQRHTTPEQASGVVRVYLSAADHAHLSLQLRIVDPWGYEVSSRTVRVAKYNETSGVEISYDIPNPELWSPSNAVLYRYEVSLLEGGVCQDRVTVATGLRSISVNDSNRLCINGEEVDVRGVGLGHDRDGYGTAITQQMLLEDYARVKDMGANAIRSLWGPHVDALYDRTDSDGVVVWIDVPFTRSPLSLADVCYYPSVAFRDNGFEQLREIIAQNYNHPSVVMWGLFSLVSQRGDDPVSYVEELNALAHKLDNSRLTVGCSNADGAINFITDLIVFRQNVGWSKGHPDDVSVWCRQLASNKLWGQLHFGVCYGEEGVRNHFSERIERSTRGERRLPERRQSYLHERYIANISESGIFWGVWLETMFDYASSRRAYGINHSGVVDYDHREAKDAYYLYRALWNEESPTLHITNKAWRDRRDTLQYIDVYCSEGATPLLLRGEDTLSMRRVAPAQWRADSVVVRGDVEVRAVDECRALCDSIRFRVSSDVIR